MSNFQRRLLYQILTASFLLFSAATITFAAGCATNGVPENGYPTWFERGMYTMINAVRISPQDYRNVYLPGTTILLPQNYPPVSPVQEVNGLNLSSRAHAFEMAFTPGCQLSHFGCNGDFTISWWNQFYPQNSSINQLYAGGFSDPVTAIGGLLADSYQGAPAPDRSGFDGHRGAIMDGTMTVVGAGQFRGPNPYRNYIVSDIAQAAVATPPCAPILGGFHFTFNQTVMKFLTNFYSQTNTAPQSVKVFINGVGNAMNLHLGTNARGSYILERPITQMCQSYHFEVVADGETYRYPKTGEFRTFKMGSCTENYLALNTVNSCPADFNRSNELEPADIFDFLNNWFASGPGSDFNNSGVLEPQDIFDFLNAWFTGCNFGAVDTASPQTPTLVAPANGVQQTSLPTFSWALVTDPSTVSYHLQVATDSNFEYLLLDQPNLVTTSYTPASFTVGGILYFRVKAIDGVGNESAWSSVRSLTNAMDITAPPIPTLMTPANGGVVAPGSSLTWSSVSDPSGVRYHVQIARYISPQIWGSQIVADQIVSGTSYTPSTSLPEGTYLWHVRAEDLSANNNASGWDDHGQVARSFVFSAAPAGLQITSPQPNATVTGSSITLRASVGNSAAPVRYMALVMYGAGGSVSGACYNSPPYPASMTCEQGFNISNLAPGAYTVLVETHAADLSTIDSRTITVTRQ